MDKIYNISKYLPLNYNDDLESTYINSIKDMIELIIGEHEENNEIMLNDVFINLTLIYTFILQNIVSRIYIEDTETTKKICRLYNHFIDNNTFKESFEKNFIFSTEIIRDNKIENSAINFIIFYLKDKCNKSNDCLNKIHTQHDEIFKYRNNLAHVNLRVYKEIDQLNKHCNNIENSLKYLYEILFYPKNQKNIEIIQNSKIYQDIKEFINEKTIDDTNYKEHFEEINRNYYLTEIDYIKLNKLIDKIDDKEIKKYFKLYIQGLLEY